MAIRGFLSHLDLVVRSPATSIRFYALVLGHLGFERADRNDSHRAAWTLHTETGAHFEIEVRPARGEATAALHDRNAPGLDHLAFHADSEADVDSLYRLLVDAEIPVDEPPRSYAYTAGYYAIGFDDPDGVRLEVVFDPTTNP